MTMRQGLANFLPLFSSETPGAAPLLEREGELRALRDALAAASAGAGSVTLVEGHAGTGASRLLAEAAKQASAAGMEVLAAAGDAAERDFAFGVARQLFEARLWRAEPAERSELLSGAAGLARELFEPDSRGMATRDADYVLRLVHGLFWVVQNLAEQRPLAVLVDDAQWADAPSLQLLRYVAPRISDLPVAVVAAYRTGTDTQDTPLAALAADPVARELRLGPLSK
jgi:predicted ATPase